MKGEGNFLKITKAIIENIILLICCLKISSWFKSNCKKKKKIKKTNVKLFSFDGISEMILTRIMTLNSLQKIWVARRILRKEEDFGYESVKFDKKIIVVKNERV